MYSTPEQRKFEFNPARLEAMSDQELANNTIAGFENLFQIRPGGWDTAFIHLHTTEFMRRIDEIDSVDDLEALKYIIEQTILSYAPELVQRGLNMSDYATFFNPFMAKLMGLIYYRLAQIEIAEERKAEISEQQDTTAEEARGV